MDLKKIQNEEEKVKYINLFVSEKEHNLIQKYSKKNQQSIRSFVKKVTLDFCNSLEVKTKRQESLDFDDDIEIDEEKLQRLAEDGMSL